MSSKNSPSRLSTLLVVHQPRPHLSRLGKAASSFLNFLDVFEMWSYLIFWFSTQWNSDLKVLLFQTPHAAVILISCHSCQEIFIVSSCSKVVSDPTSGLEFIVLLFRLMCLEVHSHCPGLSSRLGMTMKLSRTPPSSSGKLKVKTRASVGARWSKNLVSHMRLLVCSAEGDVLLNHRDLHTRTPIFILPTRGSEISAAVVLTCWGQSVHTHLCCPGIPLRPHVGSWCASVCVCVSNQRTTAHAENCPTCLMWSHFLVTIVDSVRSLRSVWSVHSAFREAK